MKVFLGLLLTASFTSIVASTPALILTSLIKKNLVDQARQLSVVNPRLFLNRTSYSGFFNVDEKHNSNLFFWFIEAENHRPDTPWMLWLQGGPGATSLAGLFDEIGPFQYSNGELLARKYTWAKEYSLLFIDNPVGTGYSFTDSPEGYIQDMSTCSSQLYSALRQFLMVFPELRKAPFFIAGESYAGRFIPALGVKILEQDRDIGTLDVDLQGIILGNPVLSRDSIADYSAIYFQWGLIDSQGLLAVKPLQDAYNDALKSEDSSKAFALREELLERLDAMAMQQQTFNVILDKIKPLNEFTGYLNRPDVRQALHVGDLNFNFFNKTVHTKMTTDFLTEIKSKVEMMLDHYRVLIYCGQMDLTAPCVPNSVARRKHWHWNHRDLFLNASRTPWWYDNRVAGYVKSGGHLTEVLVRGAGHLVPMDKPEETMHLIKYFVMGLDLQIPPNYQILAQDTAKYVDDEFNGIAKTIYQLPSDPSPGTTAGVVVSVVLNVIFVLSIISVAVIYGLRRKRRTEMFVYNNMEDGNVGSNTTMF